MRAEADITLDPDVVFTRLGEESAALLHLVTKRYYTLNGTGLRIWELLERGYDRPAIARALHQEFAVDLAAAATSVAGLVEELGREGLLAAPPR